MGEVIMRGGTATRADYEGFGLAKLPAHWHLHEMVALGFRGYEIGTSHPAMKTTFMKAPTPFTPELVSAVSTKAVEGFEECADFECCKIWVHLQQPVLPVGI